MPVSSTDSKSPLTIKFVLRLAAYAALGASIPPATSDCHQACAVGQLLSSVFLPEVVIRFWAAIIDRVIDRRAEDSHY